MNGAMSNGHDEALRRVREAARLRSPVLDLGGLALECIPEVVVSLTGLRVLVAADNRLTDLPDWIAGMSGLTGLDLAGNRLGAVPGQIRALARLQELSLSRNRLRELPDWLGELTGLTELRVSDNELTALPDSLGALSRLTALQASGNQLAALPESLADLGDLSELLVDRNRLHSVPDGITALGSLRRLDLSRNALAELPEEIGNLRELAALYLAGNRLTGLPAGLGRLADLVALDLDGNPDLVFPPPEIVAGGARAVTDFLRAVGREAVRQWTSKLLVVGEATVGKTSVSKRLGGLPYDADEPQTHGIHVDELALAHPTVDTAMRLALWDFGGQLYYRATQRFYLTNRSLFLLVWNSRLGSRGDGNRLEEWLTAIAGAAPGSPVILVATYCRQSAPDLDLAGLQRVFPQVVDAHAVDCEDGTGIAELRDLIAEHAARLPLMGELWPVSWQDAVSALSTIPGEYTTVARARRALEQAGVREAGEQDRLLAVLHDQGRILHFGYIPRLRDLVVLNPAWIDTMVTRVLDSPEVIARHGLLGRDHRDRLWADLEDPGAAELLTTLMEPFDLAYRLDAADHDDVALVVERLPAYPAGGLPAGWDDAMKVPGAVELRLTYCFDSRHAGIPSWFIAREHRFTTGTAWSRGVLLRHHGASVDAWALLVDDGQPRPTVSLTVRGAAPHVFYSLLDQGFTEIVRRRYPGLKLTRRIPCPCSEPSEEPCTYEFDFDQALGALAAGKLLYCNSRFRAVEPRQLLIGLHHGAQHSTIDRIEEKLDELAAAQDRTVRTQLRILDGMRDLMRRRAEDEAHCPSLFTVNDLAAGKAFGRLRHIKARYELQLYCEQPDAPHPLPDGAGRYTLPGVPDWLPGYAPYLRTLLIAVRFGLPLLGPAVADVLSETMTEATRSKIELACGLLEQVAEPRAGLPRLTRHRPRDTADFTRLRRALLDLDPDFGGLRERELPENRGIVYLCPVHRAALHYPADPRFEVPRG